MSSTEPGNRVLSGRHPAGLTCVEGGETWYIHASARSVQSRHDNIYVFSSEVDKAIFGIPHTREIRFPAVFYQDRRNSPRGACSSQTGAAAGSKPGTGQKAWSQLGPGHWRLRSTPVGVQLGTSTAQFPPSPPAASAPTAWEVGVDSRQVNLMGVTRFGLCCSVTRRATHSP